MNKTPDQSIQPDVTVGLTQIQKEPDESHMGMDDTRLSLKKRKQVVIEKFKGVTESFDDFGITNDEIHKVATKFYEDQNEAFEAQKLANKAPEEPWDIWRILKTGIEMASTFLKFRMGIKFFQFTLKGQVALDDENIGDEIFDNDEEAHEEELVIQYNKFTKQIYLLTMFILLGIGIIVEYVMILGTEKTQTLKYKTHTFLEYNATDIPRLFPMHELAFFEKQSVLDRMKCKLADVEEECYKIEDTRCNLYPVTSETFENCNLNLYQRLEWDTTQYCLDHYDNLEIWTNTLNPKFVLYHERKYTCLQKAGTPKGKEYCDTMMEYTPGWQIENLFNCYQVNGVEFADDFCTHKFDVVNLPTKLVEQSLLHCQATKGLKKNEQWCDLNNKIEEPNIETKTSNRIDCYDSVPIKSKYVCDAKEAFLSGLSPDVTTWDKTRLTTCYNEAGHLVLDKDFCLSQFDVYKETDGLYDCFFLMDLGIERDRQFCEWKFVDDTEKKFQCLDELALPKGGDYCYLTYYFPDQTKELYDCLVSEGLPKDSSFCDRDYTYRLLEAKKIGTTVDISEKYQCQVAKGGIPNNQNQCKVLTTLKEELGAFTQQLVPYSTVELSKKVAANEIITTDCAYTSGVTDSDKPFWKATLDETKKIKQVKVFNTLNGADSSLLNSAEVWVGDKLCGKMPKAPKLETTVSVQCESEIEGNKIEIRGSKAGTMMVCNFQVFGAVEDTAVTSSLEDEYSQCLSWQEDCTTTFSAPEDVENKLNCLNRYGKSFTPDFCLQQHSASSDKFSYPLRNKYQCLANKKSKYGKVKVDRDVTDCIAIGKEFLIEECLQDYETKYEKIGFNGGDFSSYTNLTISYADIAKAEAQAQKMAEKMFKEMFQTQVPIWLKDIEFTNEEIENYLCSQSDMKFYSNPYNDALMAPSKSQKEIILNMKCEVFEIYDADLEEAQVVIHYYMGKDLDFRKGSEEKKLYINRTELNQQYLEFSYYKDLEFLNVRKNQLFMREQDPKKKDLDIPVIKNEEDYIDFISYNMSVKLMESLKQVIGVSELERTILDTAPQTNVFIAAAKEGGRKIFGINIDSADYKERLLMHEPEVDLRMTSNYTEKEREAAEFNFQIAFQTTFTEKNFKFTYYSLSDMFIELGSMQTIAMGMIAILMYYIIILFVIDLIKKIQRMHARDRRQNARRKLFSKLPQYKRAIMILKRKAENSNAEDHKILELNQDLEITNILLDMMLPGHDDDDVEEDMARLEAEEEEQQELGAGVTPRPTITRRPTKKQLEDIIESKETETGQVDKRQEIFGKTRLEKLKFQYEELMILERKYGSRFAELDIVDPNTEVMEDFHEMDQFLEAREKLDFSQIVTIFQGRMSYFGIYYLNDTIELTMSRVVYLRKQLAEIVKIMLQYQSRLLEEVKDERKEKFDHINRKFSILSEFNNSYNAANYKNIDQRDFDLQVKNLDQELDEIRKLIAQGSESKYIIEGMKRKLTIKKPEDAETKEMKERIKKLHEAVERLCISKKINFILDEELKSSVDSQDNDQIKEDIAKVYKSVQNQEYNPVVNSVARIVKKMTPTLIGETKPELNSLFNCILDSIDAWNRVLENLQALRENHHQLYWGEFELQVANLYAFKDEESTLEIAELQKMLNDEQKDWNDARNRMQDMVDKLIKANKNLASLAFN